MILIMYLSLMADPYVLVEVSKPYATDARELLEAAHFKPVQRESGSRNAAKILHQIAESAYLVPVLDSIDDLVQRINAEVKKTRRRHRDRQIVFCVPGMPGKEYVRVIASMFKQPERQDELILAHTVPDAVARIIQTAPTRGRVNQRSAFLLDSVPGVDGRCSDLRDSASGRLSAEKVRILFGITLTALADAAEISKQALDQNPASEKAQAVLRQFERIARLQGLPQFQKPADLRKWFRRPLPLFSNHSAEELFKEGSLELVAEKVDQMLTGDFGG